MSTSILCLAVVFAAPAATPEQSPVYTLNRPFETSLKFAPDASSKDGARGVIVRGQSPGYDEDPGTVTGGPVIQGNAPPTYVTPPQFVPDGGVVTPNPVYVPGQGDPFLQGQQPVPSQGPLGYVGPQPYRLNQWMERKEVGYMPQAHTSGGLGSLAIFETDIAWRYATPVFINWIFSFEQQFDYRAYNGPRSSTLQPTTTLPGSVYRFGWDFALATPANYDWSAMISFNPSMNTDFQNGLSRHAFNFDGHGMVFFRQTPQWTWALGAGYWDRVHDKVIPYVGVIYTPTPRWELRLLFPKSRISYFLGQPYGFSTWFYTRGEYHSEAYEILNEISLRREQVEITDWRILMGFRFDNGWVSGFIEGGWVFGRDVDYLNGTPGFDINTGFIGRVGVRF